MMVDSASACGLLRSARRQHLHIFSVFYLLIAGLFFIAPFGDMATAATYYVDADSGSDSTGNGSEGAPYKTLGKVQEVVAPGDTVYCKGSFGSFNVTTSWTPGDADHYITYKQWPGFVPDCNHIHFVNSVTMFNAYWKFEGWTFDKGVVAEPTITLLYDDGITVSIEKFGYIQFANSDFKGIRFNLGATGDFYPYMAGGLGTAIPALGPHANAYLSDHITVSDCNFSYCAQGMRVQGTNWLITNCTFGPHITGDGLILLDKANDCTIQDSYFYDVSAYYGGYVWDGSPVGDLSSHVEETVTYYNTSNQPIASAFFGGLKQAGTYPDDPNRIVVFPDDKNAIPIRSWTGGKWVLDSDPSIYFQTNNLPGDNNHGDLIEGACGGVDGDGNPWTMGHPNIIQRNHLNAEGLTQGIKMEYGAYYIFRNNICSRRTYTGAPIIQMPQATNGEQLVYGNTVIDKSAFVHGISASHESIHLFNNIISGGSNVIPLTAGNNIWLSAMSEIPAGLRGANDIYGVSPYDLFVDYDNDDFRLKPSAVAIDYADPDYTDWTDYTGVAGIRKAGSNPDAGCYEYQGPVLENIADRSVYVNEPLSFTVNATDPDGDPITYSVQNLPSGATFQGKTFSWTPTGGQVATYQVTFIASDGSEQDSETITITVKSTNQAPTANAGPDQTAIDSDGNGSQQVTLNGSGSTDSDGTIQSYVWTEGGTQIAAGVKPTVTLSVSQHTITLTVTDNGGLTDTDTVVITVNESGTNQPPIANAGPDQTIPDADGNGSEQVTLNGSGSSDPGGAIQSYVWREGGAQIATGMNPTVTPAVGQHTITLTVTDNGGLTDTDTVTIAVNASGSTDNNPPSVTNCSPAPDSIQVPLNNLITLHTVDTGKGVDANSVTIKVNSNAVYSGNTANYTSATGNCRRTGTKSDYTFVYQPNEMFDFEQKLTVAVNAADLGGNVMPEYTYSFWTEMRSFGKNKRVSLGLDNLGSAAAATVRDSSGNVWAVWHAGPAGGRDIYVNELVDEAANFTGSIQLIADPADQCNPGIAVDGNGRLYVTWQDNRRGNWDVYLCSSADGVNWSAASRISDSNDSETNPAIAVGSAGGASIVWQQDDQTGNPDIHIASSSDGFATKAISQITANASDQSDPAIAVDSANTVCVVWTDKRNGSNDIYGAASNSGPWTNVPIVNKAGNQSSPAIAAETAGSILHLLWVDDASGNSDIYHAATNGLPSTPVIGSSIIDDSSGRNQVEPAIAVTGSTGNNLEVFACWQDRRNVAGAIGDTDLYFAEVSSDGGTNVFVGDDSTNSNQSQPAIGVDAQGHPYLVWSDSRSANAQIYYAGSTYLDSEAVDSELVAASAGATVGVNPASIDSVDDVSVTVPAGACPCDIRITISKIKNPQEFTLPCLAAFDFGPSGIQFNQPVTITIPYAVPASQGSGTPYWFNSLTGALSQQGITDIKDIVISPTLHAVSFKTTHFTAFYLMSGSVGAAAGGGGGGGGCSLSAAGEGCIAEFILPYAVLAAVMIVLKLRDARNGKSRRIAKKLVLRMGERPHL